MEQKKLAVIFPGIGYHREKPLLYYAAKLAKSSGYEVRHITFHDLPGKCIGDDEMIKAADALAFRQASEQLRTTEWSAYSDILLIGKSIGTISAAEYAAKHCLRARQIRYTPLHAAYAYPLSAPESCIAFLGTADPWSDIDKLREESERQQIPLYLYPECNHSLECADVNRTIRYLSEIMQITSDFIAQPTK